MSASIRIGGTPYQYEAEANAGLYLTSGERWWGTLVKFRPGTSGRWERLNLIDVHPMDVATVEEHLVAYIIATQGARTAETRKAER